MVRCELTELEVASCAHCNGLDPHYAFPYQHMGPGWWESE